MNPITAVKGVNDILPGARESFLDTQVWQHIVRVAAEVLGGHGYQLVGLPLIEDTALFARGLGEDTDVVSKEMYSFLDRGDRSLTLRPEGTAGAARAYTEYNLARTDAVQRWWYMGPMFRAERPQKGRYRQFYQIGAEFFGVASVAADVELLILLQTFCQRLGLQNITLRLNTLGDDASRAAYRSNLQAYLRQHASALCEPCQARIETNPMRVLDCKRPGCKAVAANAPDILAALTPESKASFDQVTHMLQQAGVAFERDKGLVRGLDYYTGLIFEFTTGALGAQDAILGGGRYDKLVQDLGGPATPAVGFAAGVERLALLVAEAKTAPPVGPHLYLVPMDEAALGRAFALAQGLRQDPSLRVEVDVSGAKIKNQMRRADKLQARATLVLGADELASGRGKLKDLRHSSEHPVDLSAAAIAQVLAQLPA